MVRIRKIGAVVIFLLATCAFSQGVFNSLEKCTSGQPMSNNWALSTSITASGEQGVVIVDETNGVILASLNNIRFESTIVTNITEALEYRTLGWPSSSYIEYGSNPIQILDKGEAAAKTITTIVKCVEKIIFEWHGQTFSGVYEKELGREVKRYIKKEEWVEEPAK